MRYHNKVVGDFEPLVKLLPPSAVASPLRSTVPLVDFWRTPESHLTQLSAAIGVALVPPIDLCFEFPVLVQRGRGKASFTDLMIITKSAAVALEAKFTEPRSETVRTWLGRPPQMNRREALEGWLALIRGASRTSLSVADVKDLPYQLIHRTAAACSISPPIPALVYQVFFFGQDPPDHYRNDLSDLWRRLGRTAAIGFHVLRCPLNSLPAHEDLVKRWNQRDRHVGEAVRDALLAGPLFSFGEPASQFLPR
jgi:hypothetical protein